MATVLMVKNADFLEVDESCVHAHVAAGWAVADPGETAVNEVLKNAVPQREQIASLESALAAALAKISALEAALAGKPVDLDSMKAGELIAYANKRKLDIGNIVAQAGQPKVLAAVKAAEAALAAE